MSNPWIIRWTILEPGLVSNGTSETVTSFVCPKHGSLLRSRTTLVTPSDNFSVFRMDRTAEAGKNKGGGVCFFINKKWCDPGTSPFCRAPARLNLEHLSIICRPFYLPREFSSTVVTAVYIPPQADSSLALSKLHDELSGYINIHPDAACIVAGDFNKANLKKVIPNFHQHISCPTRGLNTLDHCYTQFKNAYKAHSLPAFGKSDHAAIFLTPDYKQRILHEPRWRGK